MSDYQVIVYGNGLQAIFAACKAASQVTTGKVLLIVPDTTGMLGGLATAGGQNYWDVFGRFRSGLYQQGSFYFTFNDYVKDVNDNFVPNYTGRGFAPSDLDAKLQNMVNGRKNLTVLKGYDIRDFATANDPYRITSVTYQPITQSAYIVNWSGSPTTVTGDIFIDSSEEGRLARVVNPAVTVGRYDWPTTEQGKQLLDGGDTIGRQQAASLMLKITGVDTTEQLDGNTDVKWSSTYKKSNGLGGVTDIANNYAQAGGGIQALTEKPFIRNFNDKYGSRYAIKPYNMAREGFGSPNWWINTFLVFHVDGRRNKRDFGTKFAVPSGGYIGGTWDVDTAFQEANTFLNAHKDEIIECIQSFGPAFEHADFVTEDGKVAAGKIMYIRETIHMSDQAGKRGHNTENTNYHITQATSKNATDGTEAKDDQPSKDGSADGCNGLGLGIIKYGTDMHPYKIEEMRAADGNYVWGTEYTRPTSRNAKGAVYLPYNTLTTRYVANLLLGGFAANMCSFAFAKARVIPNLCVLGDAAGVAAGYCAEYNMSHATKKWPYSLSTADITTIKTRLEKLHVRTSKSGEQPK